jgi:hypothetical protein
MALWVEVVMPTCATGKLELPLSSGPLCALQLAAAKAARMTLKRRMLFFIEFPT